jgi:hypothetical protein
MKCISISGTDIQRRMSTHTAVAKSSLVQQTNGRWGNIVGSRSFDDNTKQGGIGATASDQTPKNWTAGWCIIIIVDSRNRCTTHTNWCISASIHLLVHNKAPSWIISRTLTQMHAFLHYTTQVARSTQTPQCAWLVRRRTTNRKYSLAHQIIRLITPPNKVPIHMMSLLGKRPLKLQPGN